MCGEQGDGEVDEVLLEGSPPRVRGTAGVKAAHGAVQRITPACAGNSVFLRVNGNLVQDHPRVCGEQHGYSLKTVIAAGSPPRVRGTVRPLVRAQGGQGITPACAGNRRYAGWGGRRGADHPRVCGEQASAPQQIIQSMGSPPRVRGTVGPGGMRLFPARITPACAGNSMAHYAVFLLSGDHPRVCGEQLAGRFDYILLKGSPPRVRGTGFPPGIPPGPYRITPACAGNRVIFKALAVTDQDHPRVCGEQQFWKHWRKRKKGSPPRVRGTGCIF